MPGQGRIGDKAFAAACNHGCPICPHPVQGPGVQGSMDVLVNGLNALRLDDPGIHSPCCVLNTWKAAAGSGTVLINDKPAHRLGDKTQHCGGTGNLVEGSANVIVGG